MTRGAGNRPELPPQRAGLGADLGLGGQTRAVLLGTACLLLANGLLLSASFTVTVLTDGASVGGPLIVIPLAVLLPTLAIMIPYAMLIAGAAAISQVPRLIGRVLLAIWDTLARATRLRRRDPFDF